MNSFHNKTDAFSQSQVIRSETRLLLLIGQAATADTDPVIVSSVLMLDFWEKYPEHHGAIKQMLGEGHLLLDMKPTPKPVQWSSLQSRLFHWQYNLRLQKLMSERLADALPPAIFKLPVCGCREDTETGDSFSAHVSLKSAHFNVERLLESGLLPLISSLRNPASFEKLVDRFRVELLTCQQVENLSGNGITPLNRDIKNRLQQLHYGILGSIDELLGSISSGDAESQEPMLFNPLPLPRKTWLKVPQDLVTAAGVDPANCQKCEDSANSDYIVGPVNIPALSIRSKKQLVEKNLLAPHLSVECGHYFLENEWVRITVECNGSLTLLDKRSGEKYPRLNVFADAADTGTLQQFGAQRKKTEHLSKSVPVRRSLIAAGPLEGRIRIRYRMKIPAYSLPAGAEGSVMSIWSTIILRADSPAVLFETKVINTAVEHRLQVRFESGTTANITEVGDWPDFSQVPIPNVNPGTRRCDLPAASASLVNWLTVKDAHKPRGLTLLTQGIHGWQLVPDTYRTLALTLFRSIGKKGAPAEISPDLSCLGPMTFNYALLPLTADESENIAAQNQFYYDQFTPVIDFNGGGKISGIQPPVEISVPDPLLVDLWKMAEDGNGIIMRVVNWHENHVTAMLALNSEVKQIFVTDTSEINKRELQPTEKGEFELTVPKRSLRTLRIVSK